MTSMCPGLALQQYQPLKSLHDSNYMPLIPAGAPCIGFLATARGLPCVSTSTGALGLRLAVNVPMLAAQANYCQC